MARVVPQLDDRQLKSLRSRAEADVYRVATQIWADDTLIVFSLPWIRVGPYGQPRDGETDFVVFNRERGILTIEVKGGGVEVTPDRTWTSIDRDGNRHRIKDPFEQAKTEKYALIEYLSEQPQWQRMNLRPTLGHAVLFPDLDDTRPLEGPGRPKPIIGDRGAVACFAVWLDSVFEFWAGDRPCIGVGDAGMAVLKRFFCQPVEVRPLLVFVLEEEEQERVRLTEEQSRLLKGLGRRNRAVISGGAGTGKTLLAAAKARNFAECGRKTLLLCYNRPLANHLSHTLADQPNLDVMSFHQLCDWFARKAARTTGRDVLAEAAQANPALSKFDVHFPHALALATECVSDRYDAIIVDEAQDFGEEFWLPVELLLRDETTSALFLFFDHNQAVYKRVSSFPISDEPFLLTRNCRNTVHIHEAAYRYYRGEHTEPPTINGEAVSIIGAPSRGSQAKRLHAHLTRMIDQERVRPEDVAVLVPSVGHREYYRALSDRPLPSGSQWSIEEYGVSGGVRVDTFQRFKGLEAAVVYLWGADSFRPNSEQETLYVTLSRAKSRLILVGDEGRCKDLLE